MPAGEAATTPGSTQPGPPAGTALVRALSDKS
jgi:hypothetical protein